jgi:predicted membrane GTPase involved in stress response
MRLTELDSLMAVETFWNNRDQAQKLIDEASTLRKKVDPLKLSLERALEYIDVDEYVKATPKNLRLRKKVLDENQRKRSEKSRVLKYVEEN